VGVLVVGADDPEAPDVRALVAEHLEFAHRHSRPEDVLELSPEAEAT